MGDKDYGAFLHAAAAIWVTAWAVFGYLREVIQHESLKLSPHQTIEALAWPAGAVVTLFIGFFIVKAVMEKLEKRKLEKRKVV